MKRAVLVLALLAACREPARTSGPEGVKAEASELARFLTGYGRFDALHLADTVELIIAPEGGGARARFARAELRDPQAWKVGDRTFVPRGLRTSLFVEPGQYMKCKPSPLGNRLPELARYAYAGVRLEPPRVRSCLETWNATFFFDTTGGTPVLKAAVYDQWEW